MKITKPIVREFERESSQSGTQVALQNFQWAIAAELLKGSGVKNIRTTYFKSVGGEIQEDISPQ